MMSTLPETTSQKFEIFFLKIREILEKKAFWYKNFLRERSSGYIEQSY